jgi:hypothetical protein
LRRLPFNAAGRGFGFPDEAVLQHQIRAELKARGRMIGANDLLIRRAQSLTETHAREQRIHAEYPALTKSGSSLHLIGSPISVITVPDCGLVANTLSIRDHAGVSDKEKKNARKRRITKFANTWVICTRAPYRIRCLY